MKQGARYALLIPVCLLLCSLQPLLGQITTPIGDSLNCSPEAAKRSWTHNIFQQAWTSIQRNPDDICDADPDDNILNARAEDIYKPYAGKIIRHIQVSNLGFERKFTDTANRIRTLATRVARTLHVNTKEFVIRNNLFQKEGDLVDPFIIADNERYLRTLDFLQDARILVVADPVSQDTVDLLIVTRDFFSMKAVIDNDGFNAAKVRLSESNFLGMGQRIQANVLASQTRTPWFGYGFEYNKNNVCGSFAHLTVAYNNIDIGKSIGYEPEVSTSIRIDRPLPSPYNYYAGGIELSTNKAVNTFNTPDSVWYNYAYNIVDAWGGYNLSLRHIMKHDSSIRDRKFLSLRYFRQQFTDNPAMFQERFDPVYNDKEAVLAQFTFFRQDFIKTQYIYGFGITEDVPYGYNVSLTAGWWKQRNLSRPYAGITADYYVTGKQGSFAQYYLRTGGFLNGGKKLDDATFLIGASYFSKLFFSGTDFKIRQYVRGTYSRIFNPLTYEPLRINNVFGLRDFRTDSAQGYERISFQSETNFFTRYTVHGFRLAPFLYGEGAWVRDPKEPLKNATFFPGIGGGLRTRNENVIFGTIEFKACVYPVRIDGHPVFKFLIASDLRYRYRTTYIRPPDIVRMNSDDWSGQGL